MTHTVAYPRIVGWTLAALGGILAVAGNRLTLLPGAPWSVLIGLALVVCGLLVERRDPRGRWLYLGTWMAALTWSFWEIGFDPLRLVPRVAAPLLVFVLMFLTRTGATPPMRPRAASVTAARSSRLIGFFVEEALRRGGDRRNAEIVFSANEEGEASAREERHRAGQQESISIRLHQPC